MFTVCITFFDCVDEYGYQCKEFTFDDVNEARSFYALKSSDYSDNGLVSVSADF